MGYTISFFAFCQTIVLLVFPFFFFSLLPLLVWSWFLIALDTRRGEKPWSSWSLDSCLSFYERHSTKPSGKCMNALPFGWTNVVSKYCRYYTDECSKELGGIKVTCCFAYVFVSWSTLTAGTEFWGAIFPCYSWGWDVSWN